MSANHAQVAKMLANPLRARILRLLLTTDTVSVPVLMEVLPEVKRNVLGHHMRLMDNAGVIEIAGKSRPRRRGPGTHQFEYRLKADRKVLQGLLWGQRATVVNNGNGRDGATALDARGMKDFAALTATYIAGLSAIEREVEMRRKAAGDDTGDVWAVAVLVAKDVELS